MNAYQRVGHRLLIPIRVERPNEGLPRRITLRVGPFDSEAAAHDWERGFVAANANWIGTGVQEFQRRFVFGRTAQELFGSLIRVEASPGGRGREPDVTIYIEEREIEPYSINADQSAVHVDPRSTRPIVAATALMDLIKEAGERP